MAPFAAFRINETTPDDVVRAVRGQPTGSLSLSLDFSLDKRFQGRKLLLLQYAYSPDGQCAPEKWADTTFINGTLQTYHVFSRLPGDFTWPDARKLAAMKPGVTRRQDVIKTLGTPNYWTTGKALSRDAGEELAYYWLPNPPSGIVNRVLIAIDSRGLVAAPPVIDDKLNDDATDWICRYNPPLP